MAQFSPSLVLVLLPVLGSLLLMLRIQTLWQYETGGSSKKGWSVLLVEIVGRPFAFSGVPPIASAPGI
eukprot:15367174-Ditylum_brightwellii.AAC.3